MLTFIECADIHVTKKEEFIDVTINDFNNSIIDQNFKSQVISGIANVASIQFVSNCPM